MRNFTDRENHLDLGELLYQQITNRDSQASVSGPAEKLGLYLTAARRFVRLSRLELAEKADVSEVEIYALEQGWLPPSDMNFTSISRIALALGEDMRLLVSLIAADTDRGSEVAHLRVTDPFHYDGLDEPDAFVSAVQLSNMPPTPTQTSRNQHILVVDDEEALCHLLRISLQKAGYQVSTAANGREALHIFERTAIDMVLMDVLLPEIDGYTLCAELRRGGDVPIVIISALNRLDDIVYGFSLGVNDYIAKPFHLHDLQVRIAAILRRVAGLKEQPESNTLTYQDLVLDTETHEVKRQGEMIALTPIEFQLLRYLMSHPDKVISKDELFQSVWGYDLVGDTNLVEVAIRRLRSKVEENPDAPRYLLTVRGTGYKFCTQHPSQENRSIQVRHLHRP